MEKVSFQLEAEDKQSVIERLSYETKQADWFRYATKSVLEIEEDLDHLYDDFQLDRRQEFIAAAVKRAIWDELNEDHERTHQEMVDGLLDGVDLD